ncbi:MAG: 3-deoxy-manno-octulosonate-8-phosphatase KdsC [Gammaproteobacteria bacterium]|nr:3-deoxy-manno-octulosonate-8-phosphatase KdsC [Gammaproteobacteria bacterium]
MQIKLLICDIDGVFSDGSIYIGNDGEELKTFNTKDGFGIRALLNNGVDIAIITGRTSNIVKTRMNSLGVTHIYQGMENKLEGYKQLLKDFNLSPEQVGYIGDDFPDIPVMKLVGLSVAPGDAHPYVKQIADLTTTHSGGRGAVRELADLIVMAQQGEHAITEQLMGTSA